MRKSLGGKRWYEKKPPAESSAAETVYAVPENMIPAAVPVSGGGASCVTEYAIGGSGSVMATVIWKNRCIPYAAAHREPFAVDKSDYEYRPAKIHYAPPDIAIETFVSDTVYNKMGKSGMVELYHWDFKTPVGYVPTTDTDDSLTFDDDRVDGHVKLIYALSTISDDAGDT